MDTTTQRSQNNYETPNQSLFQHSTATNLYSKGRKRMKISEDREYVSTSKVYHYDRFTVADYLQELESGKYGSVTKEIKDLYDRSMDLLKPKYAMYPYLLYRCSTGSSMNEDMDQSVAVLGSDIITLEDNHVYQGMRAAPVLIIDSDDEEPGDQRPSRPHQNIVLPMAGVGYPLMDSKTQTLILGDTSLAGETDVRKDRGIYVGVEDDLMEESDEQSDGNCDGLADIWQELTVAVECSKEAAVNPSYDEHINEDGEECEHSFLLKDDLGYVCRICGVVQRGIETIIEFQYAKSTRNTRTYRYEARTGKDDEVTEILPVGMRLPGHDFLATEIFAHPRHSKKMKPHQIEGFNFLVSNNLVTDNPGGCILAHAPGSGKTFMIISFIQSFMAKYPFARPLVILPRGILPTWKKEFLLWQVEDIPLLDFYSVKADGRAQQLEVLKQWAGERSILFLGYKQFSSIVCDNDTSKISTACQELLLTHPSLLILDEGHTPRNENTDQLAALEKVQTPRKVVLSGTLYQNHVKEVFNLLNLVRPKFLRIESCKAIKRRILSRVSISKRGNMLKKGDNEFYELVEESLVKDDNLKRRAIVIQDLREMTSKVLHYYKGDFPDELPGLVDFTVFLNLSPRQKREVVELKKLERKFKISSDGSALYVHPQSKHISKNTSVKDKLIR